MALDHWARLRDPQEDSTTPVQMVLNSILEAQSVEYLDDDVTQEILISVVLILGFTNRQWLANYPHLNDHLRQQIEQFLDTHQADWEAKLKDNQQIYSQALKAMDNVTSPEISESYELWEGDAKWLASCDELKQGIRQVGKVVE